jgi:hypothetical protein
MLTKSHENDLSTREIITNIDGTLLSEVNEVNACFQFKGITHKQKQQVLDEQNQQRKAKIESEINKQMEEERWEVQDMANRRTITLLDRASSRAIKEQAIALRKENELKSLKDKERCL